MTNDSINVAQTETAQPEIAYSIGGWTKVSGASRVSVILDAEGDDEIRVYTFNTIGSGTPMSVWHRRHRVIATVDVETVPDRLEEALREHEDTIRAIAARYLGMEWDGSNHVGRWSDDGDDRYPEDDLDLGSLATYWQASEWFAGDPSAVVASALDAGSIEAAVEAEVESARTEGAHLDSDDAEKAIRMLLEQRRDDLDVDDEEERAERLQIAKLLGERDEEAERAAADPTVELDLDSLEVFAPEIDDEEYDAGGALNHYVGLDVEVDGREARVGCCVGAHDSDHGTIRAAGGGVRPFCHAWWSDAADWQEFETQRERDAVLAALEAHAWELYQRACEEVGADRPSC